MRPRPPDLSPTPPTRPRRIGPGTHRRYRTIWISDVHLGTRFCRAEALADFLDHVECDVLYLVGDILDGWQLQRRWFWTPSHTAVLERLLERARDGARVVYVPGNHDEVFRGRGDLLLAGIEVVEETVHATADGRRLWVLHGDQFDGVVRNHRWLAHLGDHAYHWMLVANRWFNVLRRRLGRPYWSLSAWLKQRVKDAVAYVGEFERAVAREAHRRGVDGVVCGHIHKPELRRFGGILYANDGDWVESCTALAETFEGELELLQWDEASPAGVHPPAPARRTGVRPERELVAC